MVEAPSDADAPETRAEPALEAASTPGRLARTADAIERLHRATAGLEEALTETEDMIASRIEALRAAGAVPEPRNLRDEFGLVTLAEAARRTGRHPEVLRRWCSEGRIPAVRVGRTWAISNETLAQLLAHSARSRPRF